MTACEHDWEQRSARTKRCRSCGVYSVKPAPTPTCSVPGCVNPGIWMRADEKPICDRHAHAETVQ